ncbi:putative cysteine-rich repeat secretory protein 55-like [Capsicum annuum]|nr:putative cysteine-rich repeat secretory protein 55-like [Capsicum annuum]KAF3640171.1 putative cysteine-rich repeat secretory protein 55-like [Capsicum annuum]
MSFWLSTRCGAITLAYWNLKIGKLDFSTMQGNYGGPLEFDIWEISLHRDAVLVQMAHCFTKIVVTSQSSIVFGRNWNDHKNDESCHVYGASQFIKPPEVDCEIFEPFKNPHCVPGKVLRYFPLVPKLKRLFMCSNTIDSLRRHVEERSKDEKLRHPADGKERKYFDSLYLDFALYSRNLKLGLSTDEFNPFRTMSISHSTWKVMMKGTDVPNNLQNMNNVFWKKRKRTNDGPWKKSKTKDHAKAHYDLKEMGIRKRLHPKDTMDGKRIKIAKFMGPSTPDDNGEVVLIRNDVPKTIINMDVEGFLAEQIKVEHDNESEDVYKEEHEDEFVDESKEDPDDDVDFENKP